MRKLIKSIKILFFNFTYERFPNIFRPSSIPYISGDTFRNFSDHIFDECNSIDWLKVKDGDVVFVSGDLISVFFKIMHEKINSKYILITHNSDENLNLEIFDKFYDKKIIHWFSQNLCFKENENISLVPIGLENRRRLKNGQKKWFKKNELLKDRLILSSFDIYTNYQERQPVVDIFKGNKNIDIKNFKSTKDYFETIRKYRFAICPPGNGIDTHRIWECLLLETIPILKRSIFSENLTKYEIPLLIVEDWDDLNHLEEKFFISEYDKLTYNYEMGLYSSSKFWFEKINSMKEKYNLDN